MPMNGEALLKIKFLGLLLEWIRRPLSQRLESEAEVDAKSSNQRRSGIRENTLRKVDV